MFGRFLVFNFRLVHGVSRWLELRLTLAGRILLAAMVAAGALGIDTRQSLAYQVFALGLGLLLVASLSLPFFRNRFSSGRLLPKFATVGQPFRYRVSIRNHSAKPQRDLVLIDELAAHPPSAASFFQTRQPGEENQNWFDRSVGYPRWSWLMRLRAGARVSEQPLPVLPPKTQTTAEVELLPLRRGYLRFTQMRIARPDPFGLLKAFVRLKMQDTMLVLPRRYPLPPIQLPGSRRYQPGGVALASHVGDSEEFLSVRDYRPGDPPKHIHWKSWARVGKPIIKEFQAEFFVRHALILDTFAPASGQLFEEAVSVAASFASTVDTQDSLLDLMFVGEKAYCFTSGRGLGSSDRLLEILACVEPCTVHSFARLRRTVISHASALSGCVCIFLDWGSEQRNLIRQLRALDVPVLVLVLEDERQEGEGDPGPMEDIPHLFHALHIGRIKEELVRL